MVVEVESKKTLGNFTNSFPALSNLKVTLISQIKKNLLIEWLSQEQSSTETTRPQNRAWKY
jgi:hypothetical protein